MVPWMNTYLLQGLVLGLAYLAPIGMQNMYVINSALRSDILRTGQVAAITIAFDISLALSCFFGVGFVLDRVPALQGAMLLAGCVIIAYFGVRMIFAKLPAERNVSVNEPLLKVAFACFAVTWFNPQAVLDGTMLLGGMRASIPSADSAWFIAGVAIASALWFSGLAGLTYTFKKAVDDRLLRWINILCGTVICIYGIKLGYAFMQMVLHI